jgi:2-methoxy-6-polyprenyl-1,4-benzoquinol methylase
MSCGIPQFWKDQFVARMSIISLSKLVRKQTQLKSSDHQIYLKILDVACGTGDIAFCLLDAANCMERAKSSGNDEESVTIVDINPEMLRVGEQRSC